MVHDARVYEEVFNSMYNKISKIFKETPNPELLEMGVKHIVSVAAGRTNEETVDVLFKVLEKLVSNNIITAR